MTGLPLLLLTLLAIVARIGDPELDAADRAYREGRYAEALVRYETAFGEQGVSRGAVLFNMGNCAYRLERYAEAVLLYRRAALRLPDDREVDFNRRLAERQLGIDGDTQVSADDPLPGPWTLLIVAGLQGVGLLGLVRTRGRIGVRVVAASVLVAGVVAAIGTVRAAWAPRTNLGVVLADDVAVRAEPHVDLPPLVQLRSGETCRVEEMSDRWMRIGHPRGDGWVERARVAIVD